MQVVDVSIQYRKDSPEDIVAAIPTDIQVGDLVMAQYRTSLQRKQRRDGGSGVWMSILDTWRESQAAA